MDFQSAGARRRHFVHVHALLLALRRIPTEGFRAERPPHNPRHKQLVAQCVPVQDRSDIIFELILIHT